MLSDLKGIIFDVHRTLVDDSGFPRERIWRLLQQSGVTIQFDAYYRLYDELTKKLFNWSAIENFIKVRDIHRQRLITFYNHYNIKRNIDEDLNYLWQSMFESRIYPEAPDVLNQLQRRYRLGILSNADNDDPLIDILLKAGYQFHTIVTSEAVGAYKPRPAMFEKVLAEMKCEKDDVVLIGDSQNSDIIGAKNFGIKIVWINRTGEVLKENCPKPDYQISNLSQLLNLLVI